MAMPNPTCPKCGKEMEFSVGYANNGWWTCVDHNVTVFDRNAQTAYIATLEAENTALRQQLAESRTAAEQVRGMGEEATKDKKFRGITTYKYLGKNHTAT